MAIFFICTSIILTLTNIDFSYFMYILQVCSCLLPILGNET